jgi:DNA-binding LacI/PurR family transcriptional regulator
VAQPKQELGALAVDALLAPAPGAAPRARVLDGSLIVRESTAPPGGAAS